MFVVVLLFAHSNKHCPFLSGFFYLHAHASTLRLLSSSSLFLFTILSPHLLYSHLFFSSPLQADADFSPNVDYSTWFATLSQLFERMTIWCRKAKHQVVGFPLMTAALCVCEKEYFLTHYRAHMEALFRLRKDKSTRAVSVACAAR